VSTKIVIIPTYNEIENIEGIITRVMQLPSLFDVMVVDDGSPDGTAQAVKALQVAYPNRIHLLERREKSGLGTAYILGFKHAIRMQYDYIFEMDADFSHNPNDLQRLWDACAHQQADVAIGSRYVSGVNVVNWPMSRVLMSYFASIYVKIVTGMPISDATAGFKCYRREVLETIELDQIRFVGYAFQIEMKFRAWKYGYQLQEVPIIFTDRTRGESKMSFKIFREAFFGVLQIKIRSFFATYHRFTHSPIREKN
jgi:dolichol-phosphate mannosyltransferase